MTPEDNRADQHLDALLRAARSGFVARADAGSDFEAGLADVYSRASQPFAPGSAAAVAGEHIEQFIVTLGAVVLAGSLPDLAVSQVQRAAGVMLGLRDEVAAGSVSALVVTCALTDTRDALGQAGLILRAERGGSFDDLFILSGALVSGRDLGLDTESWLRRLEDQITRAVAGGGSAQARTLGPAGKRRRDGDQPGRRNASGS